MEFQKAMNVLNRIFVKVVDEGERSPFYDVVQEDTWEEWILYCSEEPDDGEARLLKWDRENPEVHYPTFREIMQYMADVGNFKYEKIEDVLDEEVPAAAAKEFGIVPVHREYSDDDK